MRYIFTLFLLFVSHPVFTQGIVKGRIYDNDTGNPLPGVYVLYGNNQGTASDADGFFYIETDTGMLVITIHSIGYRTVSKTINILPGDTTFSDTGLDMEIQEIGQVVVSASRAEQRAAELTVSVDIIKAADFLSTHINDAEELIERTPGIEILDGQASVRGGSGFSYGVGSRVLALIDGLPVLSPDAGNIKWQFLPLENIAQIEIIKGASSVLYGSSALNGVINFRTADATNIPETSFYAEAGIYGDPSDKRWKWWNTPRVFSALSFSHLQKRGNTDLGASVNLSSDKGYRRLNNENLARVTFRLKHFNSKIEGLAYGLNINSGYTAKRDFILWEDADYGALKQDTSTASLLHGTFIAVDPFVSYNRHGRTKHDLRIRLQRSDNRFPVRDENNSDALSLYSEYQLTCKLSDLFGITTGISENYNKIISHFYGDHEGINLAGYLQLETDLIPTLKMVAGLRLEYNSLDGEEDRVIPVFRSGINWQAADYTFLRASFGQGYRYPSIAEKFASTTLGSVKIFPNRYVEPESGWSAETGIKQGIIAGNTSGQADLSFFFSQNNGLIEYIFSNYPDPVTGIYDLGFRATNVEQSRVYGYEFEFTLNNRSGDLDTRITGGYTYLFPVEFNSTTGKNRDIFLKYRRKHSAKISAGSSYRRVNAGITLYARSRMLNIDDVFLNEATRESILPGFYEYWMENNRGYFLLDANVQYSISKVLSLSLVVKNLTNTEYMGRPGDVRPQRSYSIRLSGEL